MFKHNFEKSVDNLWELMTSLYPVYRSLCGPGYSESLSIIRKSLPLNIIEIPSGTMCFDWTVPKEFKVNEAYVISPEGRKIFDFYECYYHLWIYSQPYKGILSKSEFIKHLKYSEQLENAIPIGHCYYRKDWGMSCSKIQYNELKEGDYNINIDVEHYDGFLRIGEYYLEGNSKDEIMITCYLCHPLGANDNLSGVVISTELFKKLSELKNRRYSYRLLIIPETIGSIAYINQFPERLKNVIGGYVITCAGDTGRFHYKLSYSGNSVIDRAALHILKHITNDFAVIPYSHSKGSDECQFNSIGLRLPFGSIMRTPYGMFPQYHTSLDNLEFVKHEALYESFKIYWSTIMAIENNFVYKLDDIFKVDPFLSNYEIYPYNKGAGNAGLGNDSARAYYELMGFADGYQDLISIAEKTGIYIGEYQDAVKDFLSKNLIKEI